MADSKSKTPRIRHMQKNLPLMKINNIILVLHTGIIFKAVTSFKNNTGYSLKDTDPNSGNRVLVVTQWKSGKQTWRMM